MPKKAGEGKLRISDHWNAIRIIALSQVNPLKAIAEFVENSIDARATEITIVRGRKRGEQFLRVIDNGEGISDFAYVVTHIGDSIKRKLKREGEQGIQGEFGIGLLSFWTVGEVLMITSRDSAGVVRRMQLVKESPAYSIKESRELFDQPGTVLHIQPVLPGVRVLGGEKIQSYLASELRDRISQSGVKITIVDRTARKRLTVVPRKFHGTLLHDLPPLRSPWGDAYVELYLTDPATGAGISLFKRGTRVIEQLGSLEGFDHPPWTSGHLEGIIDAEYVNLTPGTRSGIVFDDKFEELRRGVGELEPVLQERIAEQQRAEEEEASRSMLRRITQALRRAFTMLSEDQYEWLASQVGGKARPTPVGDAMPADGHGSDRPDEKIEGEMIANESGGEIEAKQRAFFEIAGPLYRVEIRPGRATVQVSGEQRLSAIAQDRSRRAIEDGGVQFSWSVAQGSGALESDRGEFATYRAPAEPELAIIRVFAIQEGAEGSTQTAEGEAMVTVTAELIRNQAGKRASGKGLPGYTFTYLPGELWRSRYSETDALITINSGHPDFVHAVRQQRTKLRYVARLYAKEIVLSNFPGASREDLLERLVELTLYMDENLR